MEPTFEWHDEKAAANLEKHGVSFEEAQTVFYNPIAFVTCDPNHSEDEQRLIIIGHSAKWRLLFVSFTDREGAIRIISAQKATRMEQKEYEQNF